MKPLLAVSLGCPCGIGPEVALAAAAKQRGARCLLIGAEEIVFRAADLASVPRRRLAKIDDPAAELGGTRPRKGTLFYLAKLSGKAHLELKDASYGAPSARAGAAQLAWIDVAAQLVARGEAHALVTGPVSKAAIASSGSGVAARRFLGHTEHLARMFDVERVTMAFWSEGLTIALVTTHLALRNVPDAISKRDVAATIVDVTKLCRELGKRVPRIVVASLNPHAGEQGLLGDEELRVISPAIEKARKMLEKTEATAHLFGPIGAETAIRKAHAGHFDAVVAMYHDQATIPMKLVGFGEAVNVTLGLPIIRTSVDHGTGYDVAGQGKADCRGMVAAMSLATRLSQKYLR